MSGSWWRAAGKAARFPRTRERVVVDIVAEVRDILVFHLGSEEALLKDDARLVEDLGADRLDIVEVAMSCEERFGIDIPNHIAEPAMGAPYSDWIW